MIFLLLTFTSTYFLFNTTHSFVSLFNGWGQKLPWGNLWRIFSKLVNRSYMLLFFFSRVSREFTLLKPPTEGLKYEFLPPLLPNSCRISYTSPCYKPGKRISAGLEVLDNSPKHCLVLFSLFEIKLISGNTLLLPVFALSFQNFPFRVLDS